MPHTPSAKKRMRQYDKRRKYNRAYKKAMGEPLKTFTATIKSGTPEQLQANYKAAVKKLDKAAARKVIHPNKAAEAEIATGADAQSEDKSSGSGRSPAHAAKK